MGVGGGVRGTVGQGMGWWGWGGGGGGRTCSCGLQDKLSLDLKQSSGSAVTTSWDRLFQSSGISCPGKNDICLYCVLQDGMS